MSAGLAVTGGFACLSRFQGDISSLVGLRKVAGFQFAQIFLMVRVGVMTPKPFAHQNWKKEVLTFIS